MMRPRTLPFMLATLALLAAPPAASAQGLAGSWVVDVSLDAGTGQATFVFEVQGTRITGTYTGILGDQQVTGTIEGSAVRFGFDSPDAGEVRFEGTLEGNTLEGTCQYGQLGSGTFTGTRRS